MFDAIFRDLVGRAPGAAVDHLGDRKSRRTGERLERFVGFARFLGKGKRGKEEGEGKEGGVLLLNRFLEELLWYKSDFEVVCFFRVNMFCFVSSNF